MVRRCDALLEPGEFGEFFHHLATFASAGYLVLELGSVVVYDHLWEPEATEGLQQSQLSEYLVECDGNLRRRLVPNGNQRHKLGQVAFEDTEKLVAASTDFKWTHEVHANQSPYIRRGSNRTKTRRRAFDFGWIVPAADLARCKPLVDIFGHSTPMIFAETVHDATLPRHFGERGSKLAV
jgi:hypothetical protein